MSFEQNLEVKEPVLQTLEEEHPGRDNMKAKALMWENTWHVQRARRPAWKEQRWQETELEDIGARELMGRQIL